MSFIACEIVRLLKSDRDVLRELVVAVASELGRRLAVMNAILAEVAIKHHLHQSRGDMRTNFRWTGGLMIAVWRAAVIPPLIRMAGVAWRR